MLLARSPCGTHTPTFWITQQYSEDLLPTCQHTHMTTHNYTLCNGSNPCVWPVCGQHRLSGGSTDSHHPLILTNLPFWSIQSMFHTNIFQPLICLSSESQSIIIATECRNQEENSWEKLPKLIWQGCPSKQGYALKKYGFLLPEKQDLGVYITTKATAVAQWL